MLAKNKSYRPTDKEPFMSERQREYFRRKLIAWKEEIIRDAELTVTAMQADTDAHPDLVDRRRVRSGSAKH